MRRRVILGGAVLLLLLASLLVATWRLSRPKFDEALRGDPLSRLAIAPFDRALTFARVGSADRSRTILVLDADPDRVQGVDLEAAFGRSFRDGVEAFEVLGFDGLSGATDAHATLSVPIADLTLPVDSSAPHVAAGTNFREHAEEVGREEGPFLFPKLSEASPWNADVPERGRLDYEAELCAVTLTAHTEHRPAPLGYVLCNDFTDRWSLVQGMDFDAPMGTTGFPDGKGGEGMLPIGPLLVIPRDSDAFYRDLTIELWVNGRLRQRALGDQMIWSPAEIATRALEDCDVTYHGSEGTMGLTPCAGIPPRTLILTGTPGGVMFHPVTLWSAGAYLGSGDEVVTAATHLGALRNRIR